MSDKITWHVGVPPNTTVHVESSSQEVETRIEPATKHDGKLDEDGIRAVRFAELTDGQVVEIEDPFY